MVQLVFAGESQLDMIAEALNIDPLQIRIRNALLCGDPTPGEGSAGMIDVKCGEVLDSAAEVTRWNHSRSVLKSAVALHSLIGTSGL